MLDWLKQKFRGPQLPPVDPDEALLKLRMVASDAGFEEVWGLMDGCIAAIESEVTEAVRTQQLGAYPLHAATIWLGNTLAADGRRLPPEMVGTLTTSIIWALGFAENTVLLGGALGALGAIEDSRRDDVALQIFEAAGPGKPRRYWLLLKVRTDALMQAIATAFADWAPEDGGDPQAEDFVYSPTDANRMAGAFRQFKADDFELAQRHFDLASPGAQFLVEAVGATGAPDAIPLLRRAAEDTRPAVQEAAQRWLRELDA